MNSIVSALNLFQDIIVLSDTEDDANPENVNIEKPLPLVSVKQEPIDDEQEKSPVTEKNLPISKKVIPESAVVYGPHQLEPPASLFTKIDLFNIMDEHRRTTSLTNRLSVPLNIPQNIEPTQDKTLSLPSSQNPQAENLEQQNLLEKPILTQSENSHTDETRIEPQSEPNPETTPIIPFDDSPLDFEFETGNPPALPVAEQSEPVAEQVEPVAEQADEEDNMPLAQVKKNQAKAKGKRKIQEDHVDKNPVAKIQVFPAPVTRRKPGHPQLNYQRKLPHQQENQRENNQLQSHLILWKQSPAKRERKSSLNLSNLKGNRMSQQ